jgi:SAM-dependent methyltransferase
MAHTPTTPDSIKAYSRLGLAAYDACVVHLFAPRFWGCTPARLVEHYREHMTSSHADVGVGTGYFLQHCRRPLERLALIDLQPNCLRHTARRLARFNPTCHLRDVTRPVEIAEAPFDSIALGGILHCLAGSLDAKAGVFDNLASLARPGTRIFGYTMVRDGVHRHAHSRWLHGLLNRLRVIDNDRDYAADLGAELAARFDDCRVELAGSMALFSAVVPTRNIQRKPS